MSVTQAVVLGIVIGLCLGVFLMGMLIMSRTADDDARLTRAGAAIDGALARIDEFNSTHTLVVPDYVVRVGDYRRLVRMLQVSLSTYSTNG